MTPEILESNALLEQSAAARSSAYRIFAEALEYPDAALHARVSQGQLGAELRAALAAADPFLLDHFDEAAFSACGAEDDFQVEYTRLFDAAASKDACHLYEGNNSESRDRALEESLRFYDYFGLTMSEEAREFPDYIVTQLEFLHYLAYCQSAVAAQGGDPQPFRLAEEDFIERHLGRWVPKLNQHLQQKQPIAYFAQIIGLLDRFLVSAGTRSQGFGN